MSLLSGNWAQHWLKETLNLITENWKICWFSTWIIVSVIYTSLHEKTYNSSSCNDSNIFRVVTRWQKIWELHTIHLSHLCSSTNVAYVHTQTKKYKQNYKLTYICCKHAFPTGACSQLQSLPIVMIVAASDHNLQLDIFSMASGKNMLQDRNIWVNSSALGVK